MSGRSLLGLLGLAAAAFLACQIPPPRPHPSLEPMWRDYQKLPLKRALALAGDPDRAWVAAMAGGAASQQDAIDVALEGCRRKRLDRRLRVPCLVYAVDDEIVWMQR
ncbi:MAG: hypothetical protein ACQGVC_08585 [Myxococcota bacterium]